MDGKGPRSRSARPGMKAQGDAAEALALQYLLGRGLRLVRRNVRSPGRGGGEVDLIMAESDGTLVFVEVRQRGRGEYGGAAASIGRTKQRRIVFAARHFLARLPQVPPCRFDAVLVDGELGATQPPRIEWVRGAFEASAWD
ncbi:MAG: YraN family protein [Tepidimonas sp.]|uniref:YraN family protein n=1 Tax=Tepidimonas sp. TaxID=2002775 RepID=UPI00259D782F|nr:YraN family protein [Tepidimonas sp.]MDM7455778.1 YraN family protein [Tepidimonas sp.]